MKIKQKLDKWNLDYWATACGIKNLETWKNPKPEVEVSGALLPNFEKARDLIKKHLAAGSAMYIQVDSDMDGYTSAAIMGQWIQKNSPQAEIHFGFWDKKQHGLDIDAVAEFPNVKLVIVPDASVKEQEKLNKLDEMEMELLVLDHHDVQDSKHHPVVNPHLGDFPNKELSGASVVLKFIQAIDKENGNTFYEQFYDLAAMGMIADMMTAYNLDSRYIIQKGLLNIQNPFLRYYIAHNEFTFPDAMIGPIGVSFYIAPLINALIRLGTQEEKKQMFAALVTNDALLHQAATRTATNIKSRQKRLIDNLLPQIHLALCKENKDKAKILLVDAPNSLPQPLTGLLANTMANLYKKPVLIGKVYDFNNGNKQWQGSIRNVSNGSIKNLKEFLLASGLMTYVEGHGNAAGFSIPVSRVADLEIYIEQNAPAEYEIACELDIPTAIAAAEQVDDLKYYWCSVLPEPVFKISVLATDKNFRIVGKDKNTIQLNLPNFKFIKFRTPNFQVPQGAMRVSIIGKLSMNEWQGNRTPQCIVTDWEIEKINLTDIL